ncbi:MAG: HD domain-containing protein [Candidatus Omnitrophota bacterium]
MQLSHHEIFQSLPFKTITLLAKKEKKEIYLVGGFLRDLALGYRKAALDLDFCLASGALDFGRKVARRLKCAFVVLDRKHGCGRVVYQDRSSARVLTFDFVDFRGKNLRGDLLKRDFTINTLALRLPLQGESVLDFCQARRDIKLKRICLVHPKSFDEDPLRILRAFSLSAIFGFKIEPETLRLIKKKSASLKKIAGERLRDELFKILDQPHAFSFIAALDKNGVLEEVIPQVAIMHHVKQGGYHHLDVWGHSLETFKKLEDLIVHFAPDPEVMSYLDQVIAGQRKRRSLIKLAALLHDIGKPEAYQVKAGKTMFHGHERIGRLIADSVCEKLKLSTKEKLALDTIIFWHLRPGYLADNAVLTQRAVHRYFRDTREEAVSVLLVSIADQRATRGPLATPASRRRHEKVSFALIRRYFEMLKAKPLVRLVNGRDLIKTLKLKPGPIFSKILQGVEEAQVEGKVRTKKQALVLAKKIAKG